MDKLTCLARHRFMLKYEFSLFYPKDVFMEFPSIDVRVLVIVQNKKKSPNQHSVIFHDSQLGFNPPRDGITADQMDALPLLSNFYADPNCLVIKCLRPNQNIWLRPIVRHTIDWFQTLLAHVLYLFRVWISPSRGINQRERMRTTHARFWLTVPEQNMSITTNIHDPNTEIYLYFLPA